MDLPAADTTPLTPRPSSPHRFLARLDRALSDNRLILPSLPGVALSVKAATADPDVKMSELARLIAADAALSSRVIKVANGACYRTVAGEVATLDKAIRLLGINQVRNLVLGLSMVQIVAQRRYAAVQDSLQETWSLSTRTAACAKVLAQASPGVAPDTAMLAGLLHNVGALPILALYAEQRERPSRAVLDATLTCRQGEVGRVVLQSWRFPADLCAVPESVLDRRFAPVSSQRLVDLVLVARLHAAQALGMEAAKRGTWGELAAFDRLAMTPERSIALLSDADVEVRELSALLAGR
ncbi:MAG: HDOD domain-containing protein [Pseudomonadota bacterium]|nr:HDOD domain-containing protein [Pseudomonadota bacterium]